MTPNDLQLPGSVHVAPTADELYDDLGLALMAAAGKAAGQRGVFHLALSGGSTPEPFYMRLVTDPRFREIPWKQTHVWIVDERRVPEDDPRSNFRMIRESLLDHVPLRQRQIHPMRVMTDDAATDYERALAEAFGKDIASGSAAFASVPQLDFVLLGMGDDGHTASLFPGSPALGERRRWVVANDGPAVTPPPRLTMTYPLLNAAHQLTVLVVGGKKTATLRRVSDAACEGEIDPQRLPITGIQPGDGTLTWYLDAAAAGIKSSA